MKTTDLIAKYIHKFGVKTVPVFQGGNILHLIDSIARHPQLNIVCPLHEQSLSMIVETQARLTGYGVGVVTSGPGATNIVTGVADAYYDSIPCLFIAGQVGIHHLRRNRSVRQRGFQETDTVSLFSSITKYSTRIENAQDVPYVMEKAYQISKSGRPGPVFIELPYNIQVDSINPNCLTENTDSLLIKKTESNYEKNIINLINKINEYKRPVFIMGGGIQIANQAKEAFFLTSITKIPTVVTWPAVGIYDHESKEYFGTLGRSGHSLAQEILGHADLIISFGSRLNSKAVNEKNFGEKAHVIAIDIDSGELYQGLCSYNTAIVADLSNFLPKLLSTVKAKQVKALNSWITEYTNIKALSVNKNIKSEININSVNPIYFFSEISKILNNDCRVLLDTGCNLAWSFRGLLPKQGQRFISAFGHSPMGFVLPAIVGAHFSDNQSQILAIIGDGGFQLNIQELQTIFNCQINVVIIIINNKCLGNTKFASSNILDGRSHGNGLDNGYSMPNFEKVVQAYGIDYINIDSDLNVLKAIEYLSKKNGPIVVELNIDTGIFPKDNW